MAGKPIVDHATDILLEFFSACDCRWKAYMSYNSCRNRHCPKCQTMT
ncbi:MAG TPA: hypothetical protein ENK84_07175, partial [Desulfobulbus sp.]|nr:hypothetical protein [Desulfobulbus sp.]